MCRILHKRRGQGTPKPKITAPTYGEARSALGFKTAPRIASISFGLRNLLYRKETLHKVVDMIQSMSDQPHPILRMGGIEAVSACAARNQSRLSSPFTSSHILPMTTTSDTPSKYTGKLGACG